MIKKTIKYTDFNGDKREEDFYFNLTKDEIIQFGVKFPGGIEYQIEQLVKTENAREVYDIFRTLVLESYGEKSPDGKRFVKSDEMATAFEQTNAFSELILDLIDDSNYAAKFIEGLIPRDLLEEVKKEELLKNAESNNS